MRRGTRRPKFRVFSRRRGPGLPGHFHGAFQPPAGRHRLRNGMQSGKIVMTGWQRKWPHGLIGEGGRKMATLNCIRLEGLRSVKSSTLELLPLNILVGANGAGKSNILAFFKPVTSSWVGDFNSTSARQEALRPTCTSARRPRRNWRPTFVEWPAEQTFADTVLKPYLVTAGVYMSKPVLIADARKKGRVPRGGGRNFTAMQNDILTESWECADGRNR